MVSTMSVPNAAIANPGHGDLDAIRHDGWRPPEPGLFLRRLLRNLQHVGGRQDHAEHAHASGPPIIDAMLARPGSIWRSVSSPTILPLVRNAGVPMPDEAPAST